MGATERWTFRPDDEAEGYIETLTEEVDHIDSRTDAINFTINFQRRLVENGSLDLIFEVMASDEVVLVEGGQHDLIKAAVKEAIAEIDAEDAVSQE